MKLLDKTGLTHLWSKIRTHVANAIAAEPLILTQAQVDSFEDPPESGLYPALIGRSVIITDYLSSGPSVNLDEVWNAINDLKEAMKPLVMTKSQFATFEDPAESGLYPSLVGRMVIVTDDMGDEAEGLDEVWNTIDGLADTVQANKLKNLI